MALAICKSSTKERQYGDWGSQRSGVHCLEQSVQDGLLHLHTIFGLVENERAGAVKDFRRDFQAAVRRKTVHEYGIRRSERHQLGIDLIGLEDCVAHFALL